MPKQTHHKLELCESSLNPDGEPHFIYLNDFRISGGKPWGGVNILRTLIVSDADMKTALGMKADWPPHLKDRFERTEKRKKKNVSTPKHV